MKLRSLAAVLLAAAAPALGAETAEVHRGDLVVHVKVTGTVVPDGVFRLKSTIDGRIESIKTSSYTWRGADEPLAMLVHKELAAMIDARGTQDQSIMEDRWDRVFRPTPIRCPSACYVLKVFAKAHTWVKPQAVLFEAARNLKLVARVRPEDAALIRDGMHMIFWSLKDPTRKLTGEVARYVLDVQAMKDEPGASFFLYLGPDRYFDPGTEWEGDIVPFKKDNVLMVPTASLITHDGETYLPVRVSTGVTASDFTQITAGVEEKRPVLVLDDAQLHGAPRHAPVLDQAALDARRREADPDAPQGKPAPAADGDKTQPEREPQTINNKDYGGEDPYGEQ
jgi:macrolide-specific efflux system membrane fusion protein